MCFPHESENICPPSHLLSLWSCNNKQHLTMIYQPKKKKKNHILTILYREPSLCREAVFGSRAAGYQCLFLSVAQAQLRFTGHRNYYSKVSRLLKRELFCKPGLFLKTVVVPVTYSKTDIQTFKEKLKATSPCNIHAINAGFLLLPPRYNSKIKAKEQLNLYYCKNTKYFLVFISNVL